MLIMGNFIVSQENISLNQNSINISVEKNFIFREKMAQAYDFALDKIGMDIHSFPIWHDYVNFLKSVEALGSYAENQKITAVRKVYLKCFKINRNRRKFNLLLMYLCLLC